jgi:5,10-methylenetetrahydromethanopterin reductase
MTPFVAQLLASPTANVRAHPHVDDLLERWNRHGKDGIATMPAGWWREIGAIGTIDDAVAHVAALHEAGADDVVLFPAADLDVARGQTDDVTSVTAALR